MDGNSGEGGEVEVGEEVIGMTDSLRRVSKGYGSEAQERGKWCQAGRWEYKRLKNQKDYLRELPVQKTLYT